MAPLEPAHVLSPIWQVLPFGRSTRAALEEASKPSALPGSSSTQATMPKEAVRANTETGSKVRNHKVFSVLTTGW